MPEKLFAFAAYHYNLVVLRPAFLWQNSRRCRGKRVSEPTTSNRPTTRFPSSEADIGTCALASFNRFTGTKVNVNEIKVKECICKNVLSNTTSSL